MVKNTFQYSLKLDPKSEKKKLQYIQEDVNPHKTMNQEQLENFILEKYENANKNMQQANISYQDFKKYSHDCFTKIKNLIQNKKLQLDVKTLYLKAKFCYLYQDDAHLVEDMLSTLQHNLKFLNIDLTGNYLSLYGLSQILKSISRLFPKLNKLRIEFSINSQTQMHKVDLKNFDGFMDILKLQDIQTMGFDLSQCGQYNHFFECLKTPLSFPSNLREISISCQSMKDSQNENNFFENFSYIFQRLPQLQSLILNFQESYTDGIVKFLNALKVSNLQKFILNLYKAALYEETPNQIMNILYQSQNLKYLDVNFRMAARNSTDCLFIFQDIQKCTNLEDLHISLQNNDIENNQLMQFADHFKPPKNLRIVDLNLTNDYKQKRLSQEYVNHLEYPILKIPYLIEAGISFTEGNVTKYSQRLKQYSQQVQASVNQIIAFKKLISPFMVFNPTFINQDLFY
ncbi:hypothetical protein ABPG74_002362 [Tetrahymena malaccensis]